MYLDSSLASFIVNPYNGVSYEYATIFCTYFISALQVTLEYTLSNYLIDNACQAKTIAYEIFREIEQKTSTQKFIFYRKFSQEVIYLPLVKTAQHKELYRKKKIWRQITFLRNKYFFPQKCENFYIKENFLIYIFYDIIYI